MNSRDAYIDMNFLYTILRNTFKPKRQNGHIDGHSVIFAHNKKLQLRCQSYSFQMYYSTFSSCKAFAALATFCVSLNRPYAVQSDKITIP